MSYEHFDNFGTARFVTFSCYRRLPGFICDLSKELFVEQLKNVRRKHDLKIIGYVIMPEHVHLVLVPPEGTKIGLVIRELKSKMARDFFAQSRIAPEGVTRVFWQRRCYDHNCRSVDSTKEKIHYCHINPVKRRLVVDARMWKWSSYNWYQGMKDVPIEMDSNVLG